MGDIKGDTRSLDSSSPFELEGAQIYTLHRLL